MGSSPLRTRWWTQIADAIWLVSRTAFRKLASRELSVASGQLLDVVATIGEAAILAVEVAQGGLGGDDALEPADQLGSFLVHDRASVEPWFAPQAVAGLGPRRPRRDYRLR